LSRLSTKKEVILPAYTDAGLVLVIQKAGLKPVLCDISLDTFNLDPTLLPRLISEETLSIVPVHMFGLACGMGPILEIVRAKNIFVIEDCAQALGTSIDGKMAGTIGDIGFYSFNRGKNFPTYSGGCITTNSKELTDVISREVKELSEPNIFFKLSSPIKLIGLSLVVRPYFYGLFYSFIAPFKSNRVPWAFAVLRYTNFQAALGLSLLRRIDEFSKKRYDNGVALINGLKDISGIILPKIVPGSIPVFNRLPVVFKDVRLREEIHYQLLRKGIETSYMYPRSLHRVFDIGYGKEDFPNATYFAEHLLTLPLHPLVGRKDLDTIINVIKETLT
jgi:dTDP-4-amino-4,6-dideoxygalactose transaminase